MSRAQSGTDHVPAFSIITLLGLVLGLIVIWQVGATIDASNDALTVHEGDTIRYDYNMYLPDGTLLQTTRLDVAEAASAEGKHVLQNRLTYVPKQAKVDPAAPGLGWGPDGDRAVLGKRVYEPFTFDISTGDSLVWEPFVNGQAIPRELIVQPFERMVFFQEPSPGFVFADLDASIGPLHTGMVFNAGLRFPPIGDITFVDVNPDNRSILVRYEIQSGTYFDIPQLPGGVTVLLNEDETEISFRLDLEQGGLFLVRPQDDLNLAARFTPGSYRVDTVTDDTFTLSYNRNTDPMRLASTVTVEMTILGKVHGSPAAPTGHDGHDHTH